MEICTFWTLVFEFSSASDPEDHGSKRKGQLCSQNFRLSFSQQLTFPSNASTVRSQRHFRCSLGSCCCWLPLMHRGLQCGPERMHKLLLICCKSDSKSDGDLRPPSMRRVQVRNWVSAWTAMQRERARERERERVRERDSLFVNAPDVHWAGEGAYDHPEHPYRHPHRHGPQPSCREFGCRDHSWLDRCLAGLGQLKT